MIINLGCRLLGTSSDLPGSYPSPSVRDKSLTSRFRSEAGSFSLSRQGRDRDESFPIRSCSQVGFAQPDVTTGPGGLLHHLFTLGLLPPKAGSDRSFFCGTFRPLRALVLRGTLPLRARTFLPDPALSGIGAIIYSALANLTHFFDLFIKLTNLLKIIRFLTSKLR